MSNYHIPVMLKETIEYLAVKPAGWYVDCNLGGGGHTDEIIKAGGKVIGIDFDPDAIQEVAKKYNLKLEKADSSLKAISDNLILYQSNFIHLKQIIDELKIGPVKGILFDLGISSYQLDQPQKGFSFNVEAPLDMRMDPNTPVKAADLVNALHEGELAELFQKYGEESFAKPIAKKITEARKIKKIDTTTELAQIVLSVKRKRPGEKIHPATQVFQALRIAVNDELHNLQEVLPQTLEVLEPGGRLVVISFHSLEDRIVKNYFKSEGEKGVLNILTQKPLTPKEEEITDNPRSRSAKLRVAEKL